MSCYRGEMQWVAFWKNLKRASVDEARVAFEPFA